MTAGAAFPGPRGSRSRLVRGLVTLALVVGVIVLFGLGVWQVQRLAWKNDLIARVEARLSAPALPAPGPAAWTAIGAEADEYRRVTVSGQYRFQDETLVKAVTAEGPGFWVMTPLLTPEGWAVWINRGFVPEARREAGDRLRPEGSQQVSGLLRISQPGGAFLRDNDPQGGRWFSRDVAALSQSRGLRDVAPYFIDADKGPKAQTLPIGGLTVVSFRNSHLSYALTWFAMAGGLAVAGFYVLGRGRKAG